jgi:hypothetical protein
MTNRSRVTWPYHRMDPRVREDDDREAATTRFSLGSALLHPPFQNTGQPPQKSQ